MFRKSQDQSRPFIRDRFTHIICRIFVDTQEGRVSRASPMRFSWNEGDRHSTEVESSVCRLENASRILHPISHPLAIFARSVQFTDRFPEYYGLQPIQPTWR